MDLAVEPRRPRCIQISIAFTTPHGPYLEDVVVVDVRVLALVERHEPRVVELVGLRVDVRVAVVAQPATRPLAAERQVVGVEDLAPVRVVDDVAAACAESTSDSGTPPSSRRRRDVCSMPWRTPR